MDKKYYKVWLKGEEPGLGMAYTPIQAVQGYFEGWIDEQKESLGCCEKTVFVKDMQNKHRLSVKLLIKPSKENDRLYEIKYEITSLNLKKGSVIDDYCDCCGSYKYCEDQEGSDE